MIPNQGKGETMKNHTKQTQIDAAKASAAEATVRSGEVALVVEELEQVIAPLSSIRR
jgi:hypothetical protein